LSGGGYCSDDDGEHTRNNPKQHARVATLPGGFSFTLEVERRFQRLCDGLWGVFLTRVAMDFNQMLLHQQRLEGLETRAVQGYFWINFHRWRARC